MVFDDSRCNDLNYNNIGWVMIGKSQYNVVRIESILLGKIAMSLKATRF
jgi:hypothetical protein